MNSFYLSLKFTQSAANQSVFGEVTLRLYKEQQVSSVHIQVTWHIGELVLAPLEAI